MFYPLKEEIDVRNIREKKKKEKKRILGRVRHIKLGFNLNLEGDIFKVYDRHSLGYDEKILNIGTLSKNVLILLSVAFTRFSLSNRLFSKLKIILYIGKRYNLSSPEKKENEKRV